MPRKSLENQERKDTRMGIALTEFEKRAVEFVAEANGFRENKRSLILRKKSVEQCVREYRRLKLLVG